ncbi:hypothetical protein SeLEV6574_g07571 [Synchytrium endobioticum]|uniref:Uncharacterized protein n=1 Tax=Synchytrium endobioticum TaxID=286115 RepID=A0A507CKN5_9FUNG|nr:hypothetical protein SeLEV6574_g07571 [Synchytrium endobioticum]
MANDVFAQTQEHFIDVARSESEFSNFLDSYLGSYFQKPFKTSFTTEYTYKQAQAQEATPDSQSGGVSATQMQPPAQPTSSYENAASPSETATFDEINVDDPFVLGQLLDEISKIESLSSLSSISRRYRASDSFAASYFGVGDAVDSSSSELSSSSSLDRLSDFASINAEKSSTISAKWTSGQSPSKAWMLEKYGAPLDAPFDNLLDNLSESEIIELPVLSADDEIVPEAKSGGVPIIKNISVPRGADVPAGKTMIYGSG